MTKHEIAPFVRLDDADSASPIYRRIYDAIRQAILNGEFASGRKLPSTRALATNLGVSRITVVGAYDQLLAEGYLEGRKGAGTFVAPSIPEELLQLPATGNASKTDDPPIADSRVSRFASRVANARTRVSQFQNAPRCIPFKNGLSAVREFPFDIWEKLAMRVYRQAHFRLPGYDQTAGFRPLREAVATYLSASRGVKCKIEQVFITTGAQQALDLTARVLLDPGDRVWIEDPCYQEAMGAFLAVGANVSPIAVDADGFDVELAATTEEAARLVYVTPSHQYPTGATMSITRRLKLLDWARSTGAWIVEDDYNSEFRYAGRPLASLQNLDRNGRVIYVGTFSKTIFPALRLGCMIVPEPLVGHFTAAKNLADCHSPVVEQAILASFISEGHFGRHLRRMRALYEKRQDALVKAATEHLGGLMKVEKATAGMHLVGWLADGLDESVVASACLTGELHLAPLSSYCVARKMSPAVILGYTGFSEDEIVAAVKKLKAILNEIKNAPQ